MKATRFSILPSQLGRIQPATGNGAAPESHMHVYVQDAGSALPDLARSSDLGLDFGWLFCRFMPGRILCYHASTVRPGKYEMRPPHHAPNH